ncbi:unnamed protein product, partial [Polarella glacialis]
VDIDIETSDPTLARIAKRMHRLALVPESYSEPMQLGSYEPGASQSLHQDSMPDAGLLRPLSLIVYLTGDGTVGQKGEGATIFPEPKYECPDMEKCCELAAQQLRERKAGREEAAQEQGKEGPLLLIPSKAGRALLFRSHTPHLDLDSGAVHGACPAGPGGKWVVQRWFRTTSQHKKGYPRDEKHDGPSGL